MCECSDPLLVGTLLSVCECVNSVECVGECSESSLIGDFSVCVSVLTLLSALVSLVSPLIVGTECVDCTLYVFFSFGGPGGTSRSYRSVLACRRLGSSEHL